MQYHLCFQGSLQKHQSLVLTIPVMALQNSGESTRPISLGKLCGAPNQWYHGIIQKEWDVLRKSMAPSGSFAPRSTINFRVISIAR